MKERTNEMDDLITVTQWHDSRFRDELRQSGFIDLFEYRDKAQPNDTEDIHKFEPDNRHAELLTFAKRHRRPV